MNFVKRTLYFKILIFFPRYFRMPEAICNSNVLILQFNFTL